jgi:hypothetical protein
MFCCAYQWWLVQEFSTIFKFFIWLTFILGGIIAYILSFQYGVFWLIPFTAGNLVI